MESGDPYLSGRRENRLKMDRPGGTILIIEREDSMCGDPVIGFSSFFFFIVSFIIGDHRLLFPRCYY